jgi:membrane protease YdiL (CAAX protease family)
MAFILLVTPQLIHHHWPAQLGLLAGMVFVGIPIELGILLALGKRRNGSLSLRGVVRYTQHMPAWQYVALFVLIFGLALQAIYSPLSDTLAKRVFGWLPVYLSPTGVDLNKLTTLTLVTALLTLLIDGLINPVVEELYFRGYLLPRLVGWGWFAPVVSAFLFAAQHYWQPYNIGLIFLLVLPETLIVIWKRNVRFSILCHCFANSLGAVLVLVSLLSK